MSNKTQNKRVNFATSKILEYPDLLEVQLKSFRDFFQLETTPESRRNEGLFQVFQEIFPIEDTRNNYELRFIDPSTKTSTRGSRTCIWATSRT